MNRLMIEDRAGARLDVVLARQEPALTRSQAQRLIKGGHVLVNGRASRAGYRLAEGDVVEWRLPEILPPEMLPEPIPLDIAYEDADLLVVNKPPGMVTHPAPGNPRGTLANAIVAHCGPGLTGIGGQRRPGIVHRLDKDTSGLLVVAKTEPALRSLQRQLRRRTLERRYLALVYGNPRFERAEVDAPIGRDPRNRKRMAVLPPDSPHRHREAMTELAVLERFPALALLEARLHTGRTHQIRVHCAYIAHPLVGDHTYGPRRPPLPADATELLRAVGELPGQALHAFHLAFDHPTSGARIDLTAPAPLGFARLLELLGSTWSAAAAPTIP